ncbi:MAG: ABC transporter ATP-binding protein [Salinisphaera sp.]|nr:ABC transporter ATP-binding protein [Salinisphaera sp.]
MIEAQSLTRRYDQVVAADDISFRIEQGEVVGLLGHNGAGKTTVMKMLTGALEPDSGEITVDGLDMRGHRRDIQQRIGYLPENCPVYPDMTVVEYLNYQAALHGIADSERGQAIRGAVGSTALGARALDTIATLSRGYRQRVGVAQAILHRPQFVILDEPTNGLDPSQIHDMRALIRGLAEHATVLISTHILQEVRAVCDRVVILRSGAVALDARLDDIGATPRLLVTVDAGPDRVVALLRKVEGVTQVDTLDKDASGHRYAVSGDANGDPALAPRIARAVLDAGLALHGLAPEARDLETVFTEINTQG